MQVRRDESTHNSAALDPGSLLHSIGAPDLPLARALMCERLRRHRINEDVICAFALVPRHAFAPLHRWRVAYLDLSLWAGGAWLIAPSTVARMVTAINREPGQRILELGTGTGFQTALLAALHTHVASVDVSPGCVYLAAERLKRLGASHVTTAVASRLLSGVTDSFDVVLSNVATACPVKLFGNHVRAGGVLVAPTIMADSSQRLIKYAKASNEISDAVDLGPCCMPQAGDWL
ncbi:methyltransferase domain-containing protein [Microvirga massiliensis]|uniref:protein-L-isoaspartate O-methyltransferase family protein n=1 Tax=Microvirga massiliensis TaxID=1033741 RepID=UPI0009E499DD